MSLRFCFGPSGAGKSHRIYEEIMQRAAEEPGLSLIHIFINLFSGNIRHAAAQKMKHRIIGKVLNIQLQCALDIFDHGIQHDPSGTVQETWDLQLSEFCFHIGSVSFQISDDHGNVPVDVYKRQGDLRHRRGGTRP